MYPPEISGLPIFPFLDDIAARLESSASRFLILTAETAAGKSTAVPFALLDHFPGKIVLLEPRRLAVSAVASRVAPLLGEQPGETAGYRLRFETKISGRTRFEVLTEAILINMLQADPSLEGVSVVVIDEFHERSVHADLALTFLKEAMLLRDDLFVLVMSATINVEKLSLFLEPTLPAPVLSVPGRRFPVKIEYAGARSAAAAVMDELSGTAENTKSGAGTPSDGAVLVFLPGIADIRRCARELAAAGAERFAEILILHSSVPFDEQRAVLDPGTGVPEKRRVILSSAIAETSLTVPDVTVVVDSGLSRISRFDPRSGMGRLSTEPESAFSAEQRAGRAGRLRAGRCVRLWNEHEVRVTETPPEILRTDLMPVVLECAQWGVTDAASLSWLDTPPSGAWNAARDLLQTMECLDESFRITSKGRAALKLGVHPRIACTALSGGREAIAAAVSYAGLDERAVAEKRRLALDLERRLKTCGYPVPAAPAYGIEAALLAGFPDRLCASLGGGTYRFPSGRVASLSDDECRQHAVFPAWIVAPDADAGERTGRIYAWHPLPADFAEAWLANRARVEYEVEFEERGKGSVRKVRKTEYVRYGKLELSSRRVETEPADAAAAVCGAVRKNGLETLPWNDAARSFLLRVRFLEARAPDRPAADGERGAFSDEALLASLERWLVPFLPPDGTVTAELLYDALYWYCGGAAVDKAVPVLLTLANGKKRKLRYERIAGTVTPVLEAVVQELFGCFETPLVSGEPVLLRLLSPARRPLQVTRDLAGFWENTWPDVCKEMKGRYPKHNWDYRRFE
ncbi:ATP-dependent RNA helicase [Treponema brennaborense]|uniref:ATP-dependent helicase HrpB n=1 Tax=Treponema brennaborense (strain DSM 12168 / CIP 105900 / DD5/3) TaxID=906968 RepID=F4LMT5_TREBD|nr:ATP-dependent helicase C-terminal domain-containing protein [Treponema brennaborense]AEE17825.1 ATP-dependent helicase HrpB [Treponema brennaborense DSM 12168]